MGLIITENAKNRLCNAGNTAISPVIMIITAVGGAHGHHHTTVQIEVITNGKTESVHLK
eukprot:NODE_5908_length_297_cov_770.306452_g5296_i0.p2 GENE.NODE_5908_length_297_cov_770.306452_g5296_i0~~NODE_5908_length_297_cov_770.306452_g5296_i0.p2  ORF type:complete len:68 (-),score=24.23 NODE_5908_length_297_cov_770.306452_g5296_i0:94-270(-)